MSSFKAKCWEKIKDKKFTEADAKEKFVCIFHEQKKIIEIEPEEDINKQTEIGGYVAYDKEEQEKTKPPPKEIKIKEFKGIGFFLEIEYSDEINKGDQKKKKLLFTHNSVVNRKLLRQQDLEIYVYYKKDKYINLFHRKEVYDFDVLPELFAVEMFEEDYVPQELFLYKDNILSYEDEEKKFKDYLREGEENRVFVLDFFKGNVGDTKSWPSFTPIFGKIEKDKNVFYRNTIKFEIPDVRKSNFMCSPILVETEDANKIKIIGVTRKVEEFTKKDLKWEEELDLREKEDKEIEDMEKEIEELQNKNFINRLQKKDEVCRKRKEEIQKRRNAFDEEIKELDFKKAQEEENGKGGKNEIEEVRAQGIFIGNIVSTINNSKIVYNPFSHFRGVFRQSRKGGEGVITYENGDQYKGQFKEGIKDGWGEYTFENGDKYIGYWKGGKREGRGDYIFSNGNKLQATWVNDKIEGKGTMSYKNGDVFQGVYAEGRKAIGVYNYIEGDKLHTYFDKTGTMQVMDYELNKEHKEQITDVLDKKFEALKEELENKKKLADDSHRKYLERQYANNYEKEAKQMKAKENINVDEFVKGMKEGELDFKKDEKYKRGRFGKPTNDSCCLIF